MTCNTLNFFKQISVFKCKVTHNVILVLESLADASIKLYLGSSARLREELCCRAGSSENCSTAALRSVARTELLSEKATKRIHLIILNLWPDVSSVWTRWATSYPVFSGWAWHAPDRSDSISSFWSKGWVWGPALVEPGAQTALSPLLVKVCSYSRGSTSPASSNVEPPGKQQLTFTQELNLYSPEHKRGKVLFRLQLYVFSVFDKHKCLL